MRKLERSELKSIFGGNREFGNPGSCTATCGSGPTQTQVTCSGNPCTATDHTGCTGDDGQKACP